MNKCGDLWNKDRCDDLWNRAKYPGSIDDDDDDEKTMFQNNNITAVQARKMTDEHNRSFFDERVFNNILSTIKVNAQKGLSRCRCTIEVLNENVAQEYVDGLRALGFDAYSMYPPRLQEDSEPNLSMYLYIRW